MILGLFDYISCHSGVVYWSYRIGRKRSEHHGIKAFIERANPLLPNQLSQDVPETVGIFALRSCQTNTKNNKGSAVARPPAHSLTRSIAHPPVWKRDFSTSGGIATAQLKMPAIPPANRILGTLNSVGLKTKTTLLMINDYSDLNFNEHVTWPHSPLAFWCENVFQPLVRHEVHSTGRHIWNTMTAVNHMCSDLRSVLLFA